MANNENTTEVKASKKQPAIIFKSPTLTEYPSENKCVCLTLLLFKLTFHVQQHCLSSIIDLYIISYSSLPVFVGKRPDRLNRMRFTVISSHTTYQSSPSLPPLLSILIQATNLINQKERKLFLLLPATKHEVMKTKKKKTSTRSEKKEKKKKIGGAN